MLDPHLIYFADPMCSWCWGFSPAINAILQSDEDDPPIRLVLGGLRTGTREPLTESSRRDLRLHWAHVCETSGQEFDFSFFNRERLIYDKEPACRAVVVMRGQVMKEGLAALQGIQRAFYAKNRDVTNSEELMSIADELGVQPQAFCADWFRDIAKQETPMDFAMTKKGGNSRFSDSHRGSRRTWAIFISDSRFPATRANRCSH